VNAAVVPVCMNLRRETAFGMSPRIFSYELSDISYDPILPFIPCN